MEQQLLICYTCRVTPISLLKLRNSVSESCMLCRDAQHLPICPAYFLSSMSVCLWICVSVQSSVIKPRQSSPEQSENVAKAHTLSSRYKELFLIW